jgi:hypothetical protein
MSIYEYTKKKSQRFCFQSKFGQKKPIAKAIGELAMRKARIFNYYNKRPHKGNEEKYRVSALYKQVKM